MKGDLTTPQLLGIIILLMSIVIFVAMSLWFKDYGSSFTKMFMGMLPGLIVNQKGRKKGFSFSMGVVWIVAGLIFLAIVFTLGNIMFSGLIKPA